MRLSGALAALALLCVIAGPAHAFSCDQVRQYTAGKSAAELAALAKQYGVSDADVAKGRACLRGDRADRPSKASAKREGRRHAHRHERSERRHARAAHRERRVAASAPRHVAPAAAPAPQLLATPPAAWPPAPPPNTPPFAEDERPQQIVTSAPPESPGRGRKLALILGLAAVGLVALELVSRAVKRRAGGAQAPSVPAIEPTPAPPVDPQVEAPPVEPFDPPHADPPAVVAPTQDPAP